MKEALLIIIMGLLCVAIMAAFKRFNTDPEKAGSTETPKQKKKVRKQKVKSYEEHQKRMSKKKYLSEHSEYIYIPIPEAQDIVGVQDQELMDNILDAILNGETTVRVKRETYNKIINGKVLQNGNQPL